MKEYLDLVEQVWHGGEESQDRTGTGTWRLFAPPDIQFYMEEGFPAVTVKQLAWKSCVWETLFFLRGETNNNWLTHRKVSIWNEWAKPDGDLGPIYGKQWRSWTGKDGQPIDQLKNVIEEIKKNPTSRRLLVSAWNVADLADMALPPCHVMFQFAVTGKNRLNLKVYQRSADVFLGVPFNIASYALILHLVAQWTGNKPHRLIMSYGDLHLYKNHEEQAQILLERTPHQRPLLVIPSSNGIEGIHDLRADQFELLGYESYGPLRGEVSA